MDYFSCTYGTEKSGYCEDFGHSQQTKIHFNQKKKVAKTALARLKGIFKDLTIALKFPLSESSR